MFFRHHQLVTSRTEKRSSSEILAIAEELELGDWLARYRVSTDPPALKDRVELAEVLIKAGLFEEATDTALSLWTRPWKDPDAALQRCAFIPRLQELVRQSTSARQKFEDLRAELRTKPDLDEWLDLNVAFDDELATVRWIEDADLTRIPHGSAVEYRLLRVLAKFQRVDLAHKLLRDVDATLATAQKNSASVARLISHGVAAEQLGEFVRFSETALRHVGRDAEAAVMRNSVSDR